MDTMSHTMYFVTVCFVYRGTVLINYYFFKSSMHCFYVQC